MKDIYLDENQEMPEQEKEMETVDVLNFVFALI